LSELIPEASSEAADGIPVWGSVARRTERLPIVNSVVQGMTAREGLHLAVPIDPVIRPPIGILYRCFSLQLLIHSLSGSIHTLFGLQGSPPRGVGRATLLSL